MAERNRWTTGTLKQGPSGDEMTGDGRMVNDASPIEKDIVRIDATLCEIIDICEALDKRLAPVLRRRDDEDTSTGQAAETACCPMGGRLKILISKADAARERLERIYQSIAL